MHNFGIPQRNRTGCTALPAQGKAAGHWVSARGINDRIDAKVTTAIREGRFLLISPFEQSVQHITEQTADVRNRMIVALADEIVLGHSAPKGKVARLIEQFPEKKFEFL